MMLFIIEDTKKNVFVTDNSAHVQAALRDGSTVIDRHDFKNFDDAERGADLANRAYGNDTYIATDGDNGLWPRYDVVRIPQVGDEVSVGFNGDSYPRGVIVSVGIGVRMTVTTDRGGKYNRFRKTGTWREAGSGWSLIQGHHNDRNPSF